MSHGHFIEKCKICKIVISQCRCMATDKSERWSVCLKCSKERVTVEPTLVRNCARCGQDHEVFFNKFTICPRGEHTHFAICPTNGEPILMHIVDVPEEGK